MFKSSHNNTTAFLIIISGYLLLSIYIFNIPRIEWPERTFLYLFAILLLVSQYRTNRLYFASPLFILGSLSLFYYCIIPSLYVYLWQIGIIAKENLSLGDLAGEAALFSGGNAEKAALIFALACLLGNFLFSCSIGYDLKSYRIKNSYLNIMVILLCILIVIVNKYGSGHVNVSTLKSLIVTNIFFILSIIILNNIKSPHKAFAMFMLVALLLMIAHENKRLAFFAAYTLILALIIYRISYPKIIMGMIIGSTVLLALLMNITSRYDKGEFWANLQEAVSSKILRRQIVTNKCFAYVVDRHWDAPPERNPLYFLDGLIPRFIWKDKPSISNGAFYEREYCNHVYMEEYYYQNGHSSSITLLGEPLLRAGKIGLLIDLSILITALAWITRKAYQKGSIGLATLGAMTPWLVDFDQDFTLYVANAVKFFLCLLPLIILAHCWEKCLGIKHEPTDRPDS